MPILEVPVRMSILLPAALAACVQLSAPADPPSATAPPPGVTHPGALDARISAVYEGTAFVVEVLGAPRPARVELVTGAAAGAGPCVPELAGLCLEVTDPVRRLVQLEHTPRGAVAVVPADPSWSPGQVVALQVVAASGGEGWSSPVLLRAVNEHDADTGVGGDSGWEACLFPLTSSLTRVDFLRAAGACTPATGWGAVQRASGTCTDRYGVSYDVFAERPGPYGGRIWYFARNGDLVGTVETTDCNCFCGGSSFQRWNGLPLTDCPEQWTLTQRCQR